MNNEIYTISTELKEFAATRLIDTGITYFEHSRIFPDGKVLLINNDPFFLQHFLEKKYTRPGPGIYSKPGMHVWSAIPELLAYDPQVIDMRSNFNIDHGISIISPQQDYIDIYDFATTSNNLTFINYVINNRDSLHNFFLEYLDKFGLAWKNLENNSKVIIPIRPKEFKVDLMETASKLTKREIECLDLLAKGHTAKMIGNFFNYIFTNRRASFRKCPRKILCKI